MKLNGLPLASSKQRFYLWILLAGILAGSAVTLLAWLQKWTLLRAPHWLYAALFWAGVAVVIALGIFLRRRHSFLARLPMLLSILAAIGLAWLFPETLAPGCGGIPRALAHLEERCTTTCTTVCTWWVPLSNPTCAAQPHNSWDIGCCWAYGDSCTTSCNNVWVDDPPTVSGSISCTTPGNNGWCRGGAMLNLSGSDPQGYPLTISGLIGEEPFSCSGSCSQSLPDGTGSASYTTVASGGKNLSSASGSSSFQVDGTPPSLTLLIAPPGGLNGWFTSGPVTATAAASDDVSGLAGVSFEGGGDTFTASQDGFYNLAATAYDNAGNSVMAGATIQIDSTPPDLSVSTAPADGDNGWYRSPAIVNATADDATSGLAGVQFQIDGGAWQDASEVAVSVDGVHPVEFQAWDAAGNYASTSPVTIQVDSTPPEAAASIPVPDGLNGWHVSPVTITANSFDPTSGLADQGVSLDGSSWTPSLTLSTDGEFTLQVHAQDNAGNHAASSTTVKVDMTAPEVDLLLPASDGDNGWYVSPVTLEAGGSDAVSGVASRQVSLDGSTWSPELALTEDGVYAVQGRVIDNAGNTSNVIQTVLIDQTPPSLDTPVLSGTPGLAGWYTSIVQFATSASDATSGLASLLYSVDGGAWLPGPLALADGRHAVHVQATDQAGNVAVETQLVDVDATPPQSGFISPAEGSIAFAHGSKFVMSGQSADATSGLEDAHISLDGGSTWQPLAFSPDGAWSYTWDTTTVSNGPHTVLVGANDQAGNIEHTARITVIVANLDPSVWISDSFWIFQDAEVGFSAGVLPITGARIVVSDGDEHSRTFNYSAGSLPSSFQWDGIWDDGSKAYPGSYPVMATAWDMFGNDAHATGTVHVPYPRSTPTATPTQSPTPTATPTMPPPATPSRPPATPLPPAPVQVEVPQEPQMPVQRHRSRLLWPFAGFVALLASLATASLSDPRPRALEALGKALENLQGEQP